jgi:hypothetical protein
MKRHGVTVERTGAPLRIVRAKPHITAAECFALSLAKLAARDMIDRDLLETVFDEAETISLDGEMPTPATTTVRGLWGKIANRVPE